MANEQKPIPQLSSELTQWYTQVRRDLPWRKNHDPYRIWVSEVMLQQTTVVAVIPFFERFMTTFPTLQHLAKAKLDEVIEHWAGLGYYSRARNLHLAAGLLAKSGFPRTHIELVELPGFGPYTARAVSSLAFGEKTGVLDGNVIRVLSRVFGLHLEWWKPQARARLQDIADRLAQVENSADLNQGLMELGATVCTPHNPACLLCPWAKNCVARKTGQTAELPTKRPRREREIWHWMPKIVADEERVLLIKNDYAPFLKGHWILPGKAERLDRPPAKFDYRGAVTHHDIFVSVARQKPSQKNVTDTTKWVPLSQVKKEIPSSLIRKALQERHVSP